jgi:hypothetical protein
MIEEIRKTRLKSNQSEDRKRDGCGYTSTSQLDFLRITRWEKARTKQINDIILGITFSREQTNCL